MAHGGKARPSARRNQIVAILREREAAVAMAEGYRRHGATSGALAPAVDRLDAAVETLAR